MIAILTHGIRAGVGDNIQKMFAELESKLLQTST
jgi:hypothetical protein